MTSVVIDRSLAIKKTDKGTWVVMCGHEDHIVNAEKDLGDVAICKYVAFKKRSFKNLAESSNKLFKNL